MSVKKYFIAIVIPPPLLQKIEAVKHDLFLTHGLKGALRSPAHITLHRPFEWKEEKEARLMETLSAFKYANNMQLALQHFAFFEPRVIYVHVIKNETLFELHAQLKKHCARELKLLNEVEDKRGFHPHVTVAFRDLKKPLFYELQVQFQHQRFEGVFDYKGFSLLKLGAKWEELVFFPAGE